jgi:hypothetical protein
MSRIIIPQSRQNVQITGQEKVCVLVHSLTKRILCFARDDWFANSFASVGYDKITISHAHEYDTWAKRIREQAKVENEAEDAANLEKEDRTRKKLRGELTSCLSKAKTGAERLAIEQAVHCLDYMERRRKRYREESFHIQEGFDQQKSDVGESIVKKAMKIQ